jgi:hypothetical protein
MLWGRVLYKAEHSGYCLYLRVVIKINVLCCYNMLLAQLLAILKILIQKQICYKYYYHYDINTCLSRELKVFI